jgi:hypothetical protein
VQLRIGVKNFPFQNLIRRAVIDSAQQEKELHAAHLPTTYYTFSESPVCGGYGGTLVRWRNNTRKPVFTPRTRKRNFNRSNRLHHLDKSQIPMFQFMPDRPEVITVLDLLVVVGFCFVAKPKK